MYKKTVSVLLLTVLLLTACANPNPTLDNETTLAPETNESTAPSDNETTPQQESESDTTEQIPPEDLLTEFPQMEYWNGWLVQTISKYKNPALKDIEPLEGYRYYGFSTPFSGYQAPNQYPGLDATMSEYYKEYRIQHITLLDENHVCVIYKILCDNQEKYMYRVFEKKVHPGDPDKYNNCEQEYWYTTFENYYLTKTLKHSDFSDFKVGDSLETLNAIEPACWIDDVWSYGMEDDEGALYISFPLLLEDGALHLTFRCENYKDVAKQENIKSLFLATDIQFYPNGTDAEINGQPLSILKAPNRPPLPGEDD